MLNRTVARPEHHSSETRHAEVPQRQFQAPTSLTEQIANHLTTEIITGRLRAGQRIGEQDVAQTLGVSRGSVREALLIVERRHLIDIVPRRGAVVSRLSRRQLDDLFDLEEALYAMIGQQMAQMWDEDDSALFSGPLERISNAAETANVAAYCDACEAFLEAALGLVRNHYLDTVVDSLQPLSRRAMHCLVELDPALLQAGAAGWQRFFTAMASADPAQVTAAVSACFTRHRLALLRLLQG